MRITRQMLMSAKNRPVPSAAPDATTTITAITRTTPRRDTAYQAPVTPASREMTATTTAARCRAMPMSSRTAAATSAAMATTAASRIAALGRPGSGTSASCPGT